MIIEITTKRWPRIMSGSVDVMQAKARLEGKTTERNAEYCKRHLAGIKGAATKREKRAEQADADIAELLADGRALADAALLAGEKGGE